MFICGGVLGDIYTGYTKLNNCYAMNSGLVYQNTIGSISLGSIIGTIENNESIRITNCSTPGATAIGSNTGTSTNQTITNVNAKQTNLPSVLSVMNTDNNGVFVEDTKNINNGYPILKWQLENL